MVWKKSEFFYRLKSYAYFIAYVSQETVPLSFYSYQSFSRESVRQIELNVVENTYIVTAHYVCRLIKLIGSYSNVQEI